MIEVILVQIFVIFLLAKLAGEAFERLRQPAVIGELFVGIIIANTAVFDWLQLGQSMEVFGVLAEIGVIVLLFSVGLETRISELSKVGKVATSVAVLGVAVPFGLGFSFMMLVYGKTAEAMFIGAAMVATSVGITARVLADLKATGSLEARVILGAAVIDDVLGMMVLTVVTGMSGAQHGLTDTVVVIALALVFVMAAMFLGGRIVRKVTGTAEKEVLGHKIPLVGKDRLATLRQRNAPFVVALIICFGLSALASFLGLAAIIGAFLAGMSFAEVREKYSLREKMDPVNDFLVPFFFVNIGLMVHMGDFAPVVGVAIVITVLAVAGKLIGCGLAALPLGRARAITIGVGMIPRGEVGIIVAMVGLSLNSIPNSMFSVVVFMSIATTLMAPPLLVWAFRRPAGSEVPHRNPDRKIAEGKAATPPDRKSVQELVGTKARRRK
jgi:Kef-type K+ transport system membrane component KefB